jgi:N-acylneuraminate cytidylyltransferase
MAFAILRPTSPFRTAATIRRAYQEFSAPDGTHDSLRAVELVKQNPYKMWTWQGAGYPIKPLLSGTMDDGTPIHSAPSQAAPTTYLQNSSLEMGFTSNVETHGSIAGRKIIPFFTRGYEGFSIDEPGDFERAESLVAEGAAILPELSVAPVPAHPPALTVADLGRAMARGGWIRGTVLAPVSFPLPTPDGD